MFKIGDRVKVKIAEGVEQCGKVIKEEENGQSLTVLFQNGNYDLFLCEDLTLITDPMDCLMVGDILKTEYTKRQVLGVNGNVYLLSFDKEFEKFQGGWTMFELKRGRYTFVQPNSPKIQEAYDLLVREGKIVDGKIIK